ncbi:MAG: hypothetical protein GY833_00760 [Aestuariibacter sp.]|nr:hypothetical protein [Aestuariibacter sp.]
MQKVHAVKLARIAQLVAGQPAKPKKRVYVRLNERLARYFDAFEQDYLVNAMNQPPAVQQSHPRIFGPLSVLLGACRG